MCPPARAFARAAAVQKRRVQVPRAQRRAARQQLAHRAVVARLGFARQGAPDQAHVYHEILHVHKLFLTKIAFPGDASSTSPTRPGSSTGPCRGGCLGLFRLWWGTRVLGTIVSVWLLKVSCDAPDWCCSMPLCLLMTGHTSMHVRALWKGFVLADSHLHMQEQCALHCASNFSFGYASNPATAAHP